MGASTPMKTAMLWLITVALTLSSVVYQRMTGPTYPVRGHIEINGQEISYRLPRSHDTNGNAPVEIAVPDRSITGEMELRRYKSHDDWTTQPAVRNDDNLVMTIPEQPAAGKVIYKVTLHDADGNSYPLSDDYVILRFKGAVPPFILFPHILFMFVGMLLATRTGLEGIAGGDNLYRLNLLTLVCLGLGGLILGPIVQKYAFHAFWTGWPFGEDLTDNKTLVAVVFWVVAFYKAKYRGRGMHAWAVIAAVVTLLVYLIPHSTLGSEIDYTKMEDIPQ
jgi:hypothetical protein